MDNWSWALRGALLRCTLWARRALPSERGSVLPSPGPSLSASCLQQRYTYASFSSPNSEMAGAQLIFRFCVQSSPPSHYKATQSTPSQMIVSLWTHRSVPGHSTLPQHQTRPAESSPPCLVPYFVASFLRSLTHQSDPNPSSSVSTVSI